MQALIIAFPICGVNTIVNKHRSDCGSQYEKQKSFYQHNFMIVR